MLQSAISVAEARSSLRYPERLEDGIDWVLEPVAAAVS
jgi:hypothetical protein